MKKIFPIAVLAIAVVQTHAQVNLQDSVSLQAGSTHQVFYKMSDQAKAIVPYMGSGGWDIGFQTDLMNASIIADPNSVMVYKVPNADSTSYSTLDTTGYQSWLPAFNSDTSWLHGAFNIGANAGNPFDFGWGTYDFGAHEVYGDSIFLIKKGATIYKFWIRMKTATGDYLVRYSDYNNPGDVDVTIPASGTAAKNFLYLNLNVPYALDLEPAKTDWDVLFTRYFTFIPGPGWYPVVGVFNNIGVTAAQASAVDVNTVSVNDYMSSFTTNMTEIGYDWKFFNMSTFQYEILDSLVYFVKGANQNYYSIQFTGYNSSTSTITFILNATPTGINELSTAIQDAGVFPNPAKSEINLAYTSLQSGDAVVSVYELSGRKVYAMDFAAQPGTNVERLQLPKLSSGMYLLKLDCDGSEINLKLNVQQ